LPVRCLSVPTRRYCKTHENASDYSMHDGLFCGFTALAEAPDKQCVPFRAVETDYVD
jgi:hypothetical protein